MQAKLFTFLSAFFASLSVFPSLFAVRSACASAAAAWLCSLVRPPTRCKQTANKERPRGARRGVRKRPIIALCARALGLLRSRVLLPCCPAERSSSCLSLLLPERRRAGMGGCT
jgi:hypothetical protein